MAIANTRLIRIRSAAGDDVTVPRDIAELLGPEARLTVEPGHVTISRIAEQDERGASAGAQPLKDHKSLRHLSRPLTAAERQGLTAFLSE